MPRPKSALAELEVELLMFLFCSACCLCDSSATSFAVATALCCGGFSLPLFGSSLHLACSLMVSYYVAGATFSSFMLVGIAGFLVFLSLWSFCLGLFLLSGWWLCSSIVSPSISRSSSLHFFGRCHIQFSVAKLATAALVKGTLLFRSKKIKINLGKAFLDPNLFRAARVYFLSAFPCLMAPSPVLLFLAP